MGPNNPDSPSSRLFPRRHAVLVYFLLTYAVSWSGAFLVAAPYLLRRRPVPMLAGLIMFPVMLVGPAFSGIFLARFYDGKSGLQDLFARMRRLRFPSRWYAALLIPPAAILAVLFALRTFVSSVYSPNRFFIGLSFGLLAALFEEIGWMGFAFPRMRRPRNALGPAILLGLLWSCWHIPVINYLGTATPHGAYWLRFFLAFAAVMTAMRVIICWTYANTQSVALAQLLHASSTGFLVVLSPSRVNPVQEAFWYFVYAVALWVVVLIVASVYRKSLVHSDLQVDLANRTQ
jgi:CAAX protease family protein